MTLLQRATILVLTAATQLLAHSALADSPLAVTANAAFAGGFGLEATVTPCLAPDASISGPVSGLVEGCSSVTAHDVTVTAPGAVFNAGERIVLGNGFQMEPGATFEAIIGDRTSLKSSAPTAERTFRASYYLRLDALVLDEGEDLVNFAGESIDSESQFRVILRRNTQLNEDRLRLAARLDDGTEQETPWGEELLLPVGWNHLEVIWRAGPGTGYLLASINGSSWLGLTDLTNNAGRLDSLRWGAMSSDGALLALTSGVIHLDEFKSWR